MLLPVGTDNFRKVIENKTVEFIDKSLFIKDITDGFDFSMMQYGVRNYNCRYTRGVIMKAIKGIIFYPMLFVRGVFIAISKVAGFMLLFGFFITLFLNGVSWELKLYLVVVAFILFLLRHFYDVILLKLNPTNTALMLSQ